MALSANFTTRTKQHFVPTAKYTEKNTTGSHAEPISTKVLVRMQRYRYWSKKKKKMILAKIMM